MPIQAIVASVERARASLAWQPSLGQAAPLLRVRVITIAGARGYGEASPYADVSGETVTGAAAFIEAHRAQWAARITDLPSLQDWIRSHQPAIDRNPCAWSAVELALLDAFARQANVTLEALLGLPALPSAMTYTASLMDTTPQHFDSQLSSYICAGFHHYKVQLRGDPLVDRTKVDALEAGRIGAHQVRASMEQPWVDATPCAGFIRALDYAFWALEEPLWRASLTQLALLGKHLNARIVLDQSCARVDQLPAMAADPSRWIIKVRPGKMGGLLRSMELITRARAHGLDIVLGMHRRETPLQDRAILGLAVLAGDALLGVEGAFCELAAGAVQSDQSIRVGPGGVLDASALNHRPGHGLAP